MRQFKPFKFVMTLMMLSLLLNACQNNNSPNEKINVIQEDPPTLNPVDKTVFLDVGCTWQSDDFAVCEEESAFKKMGCDSLTTSSDFFNLLDPNLPIITCNYAPFLQEPADEGAEGMYDQGCATSLLVRYVAAQNGNYQLIHNISALQSLFAPIQNEKEALAYAIAATGNQPLYDIDSSKNYRFLINEIPETRVEVLSDGFEVLLYDYQFCGCGPHTYSISKVKVMTDGTITVADPIPAFEDPEQDQLCVD